MGSRSHILSKQVWQPFLAIPALATLDTPTLAAMDGLFEHLSTFRLTDPDVSDLVAWSDLGAGAAGLDRLLQGIRAFDPADPNLPTITAALAAVRSKAEFRGTSSTGRQHYERTVSVPPDELPARWQALLADLSMRREMGDKTAPAPSIQERMGQRLGQYIFVMRCEGLDEDLHQTGLTAFYADLSTRRSMHGDAPLRPATLRSTWEELARFARHAGWYPDELMVSLRRTLNLLRKREDGAGKLKYAKAHEIGEPVRVVADAFVKLASSALETDDYRRHIGRNRAAAMGLPAILPLRREWHRIVLGETLFWAGDRYRFRDFKPAKTSLLNNRCTFPGSIHPKLSPLVDALVLQDNDPKYLGAMRAHVEKSKRALFVNPDGTPCVQSYVARVWGEVFGTGANIARTLVHDFFGGQGEEGVLKAMILCDQYLRPTADHYTPPAVGQRLIDAAQDSFLDELDDLGSSP